MFVAFRLAPAVEANLLNYLWPLLIVLLSPVLLPGYHLNTRHILGALAGFVGAALVVTGGKLSIDLTALPGCGCAALAALLWAGYSLLTKRVPAFPPPPSAALPALWRAVAGLPRTDGTRRAPQRQPNG